MARPGASPGAERKQGGAGAGARRPGGRCPRAEPALTSPAHAYIQLGPVVVFGPSGASDQPLCLRDPRSCHATCHKTRYLGVNGGHKNGQLVSTMSTAKGSTRAAAGAPPTMGHRLTARQADRTLAPGRSGRGSAGSVPTRPHNVTPPATGADHSRATGSKGPSTSSQRTRLEDSEWRAPLTQSFGGAAGPLLVTAPRRTVGSAATHSGMAWAAGT